jgi:hypothetical protein
VKICGICLGNEQETAYGHWRKRDRLRRVLVPRQRRFPHRQRRFSSSLSSSSSGEEKEGNEQAWEVTNPGQDTWSKTHGLRRRNCGRNRRPNFSTRCRLRGRRVFTVVCLFIQQWIPRKEWTRKRSRMSQPSSALSGVKEAQRTCTKS